MMDSKMVETLEAKIEQAIAEAILKMSLKLPFLPDHETTHLMAKAAVAVYEAVVETQRARE